MKMTAEDKRLKRIDRWADKFKRHTIYEVFNGTKRNPPLGMASTYQKLVRLAAADDEGRCTCISCLRQGNWLRMNGGHYISRRNLATIIDSRNVWPQCIYCNSHQSGNLGNYRRNLVGLIGEDEVIDLENTPPLPDNYKWNLYGLAVVKVDMLTEITFHLDRLKASVTIKVP